MISSKFQELLRYRTHEVPEIIGHISPWWFKVDFHLEVISNTQYNNRNLKYNKIYTEKPDMGMLKNAHGFTKPPKDSFIMTFECTYKSVTNTAIDKFWAVPTTWHDLPLICQEPQSDNFNF